MSVGAIKDGARETPAPAAGDLGQRPDQQLAHHVTAHVVRLQEGYLANRPQAVASLARLRRAVTAEPGSDPSVWFDTFDGFPGNLLGRTDVPSAAERAAHAAITIYAVHQQSRIEPMHRKDVSLGAAVRRLGQQTASEEATLRRFHALGTASSLPETMHHLRGLATQLRGASVALDYGRLARDLLRLQSPRTSPGVRLEWGRDYYSSRKSQTDLPDATTPPTTHTQGDAR